MQPGAAGYTRDTGSLFAAAAPGQGESRYMKKIRQQRCRKGIRIRKATNFYIYTGFIRSCRNKGWHYSIAFPVIM
jgi:hypothetical protein